jgi:hypothetical protein
VSLLLSEDEASAACGKCRLGAGSGTYSEFRVRLRVGALIQTVALSSRIFVISACVPRRMGGPQYPVPGLT